MEIVETIFDFLSKETVTGFGVIGIALVQIRKVLVKRIENRSIQNTNETNLKIEREKSKTALRLAEYRKSEEGS